MALARLKRTRNDRSAVMSRKRDVRGRVPKDANAFDGHERAANSSRIGSSFST
jgi:hypothetical protein